MALYLNLYHEIQKQKLKRQRDPFKIGIMVILMIAVGFIAWYFWRLESVQRSKSELLRVQAEWKTTEPDEKKAIARRDELDQNVKIRDAIVHQMENRFYWAPLLEHILHITPPEVQITSFEAGFDSSGPNSATATSARKVKVTLIGISAGAQPRTVAEKLRTTLQDGLSQHYQQVAATFRSLEDNSAEITVQYQGRNVPTANFAIDLNFSSPDITESEKTGGNSKTRPPKQ